MARINFHSQDLRFKLPQPRKTSNWIKAVTEKEGFSLSELNFVFCSDDYLGEMNLQYLKHKTLTDIITFDNSEKANSIEGDIFISIDRVRENAFKLKTDFAEELHRVIIHGVLHLIGYSDKTPAKKAQMRKMEDLYLRRLFG